MTTPPKTQSVLDSPIVSRVRRNHGLEHATLQVLARRFPRQSLSGYSYPGGFWIVGNVRTETLQSAVDDALLRLKNGESRLAIHPGCGTNHLTTGVLAGLAAGLAMLGAGRRWRDRLARLPLAISLASIAVVISQPLGNWLQERVTTDGNPGNLQIIEIMRYEQGRAIMHRVRTRG
jgi:hypothetical protein